MFLYLPSLCENPLCRCPHAMTDALHPLDDFLRRVYPFIDPEQIYQSLKLSCVAAKRGSQWLLVCGKAVLSTEPRPSRSRLSRLVRFDDLLVLSGRLEPEYFKGLVSTLKHGWVVQGFHRNIDVRLTPEGASDCTWRFLGVRPGKTNRWKNQIAVTGYGAHGSCLMYPPEWQDIDDRLRENKSRSFDGLNGLFKFLRLNTSRDMLSTSFFEISAELPAQFRAADYDRKSRTLEIEVDRAGKPVLRIEWIPPGGELTPIEDPFPDASMAGRRHFSIPVLDDATVANLLLSYAGIGLVDTARCGINRESTLLRIAQFFDPNQKLLKAHLDKENDVRANAFELAVARLLSTSGFAVLWFGKGSRDALPDSVAYWRSPLGKEYFILAECTLRNPSRKLTDLVNRRDRLFQETGVAPDRWLTVVFSRDEAAPPDFDAAAACGVVLCGGKALRDLVQQVTSGASPSELYVALTKQRGSIPLPIPGPEP